MKVLSDEHKKHIGEATKRMWEEGKFDSPKTRKAWRKTALKGIAKKGRPGPNKRIPSQGMLDDLTKMCDQDFISKWKVSRIVPIKLRKRYGIQSFVKQHGTVEHRFESGVEYKWCGSGKHWESIDNFNLHSSRWDGLRSTCKIHEKDFPSNHKGRKPWNTRKHNSIRKGVFVSWNVQDELRVYKKCHKSCAYCQTPIDLLDAEFDHFIPIKLGGKTEPSNMLPSCSNCNRGRGGKFYKEPHAWLLQRFGPVYGQKIYDRCVKILSNL